VHRRTLLADKQVLEAIQSRTLGAPAGDEINVTADVAALKAHRIVALMLAQERGRRATRAGVPLHV